MTTRFCELFITQTQPTIQRDEGQKGDKVRHIAQQLGMLLTKQYYHLEKVET